MKPALIATIVLSVVVCLPPGCKAEQGAPDVPKSTKSQNPTAPPPSISDKQAPANNQPCNPQSANGDATAQWVLIIVTIITAGFIGWQALETKHAAKAAADSVEAINKQAGLMERQAKASEDAAKATQKTAEAIIKIERAFIDVYLMKVGTAVYQMEVTNAGRTVAKIKEYSLVPRLSPPNEKLPEAARLYNFQSSKTVYSSKFLKPTEDKPWIAEGLNLVESLGRVEFADVFIGKRGLAYWGVIRYDDIAGEPHETRFCYCFNAAEGYRCLIRVEAHEYNEHT